MPSGNIIVTAYYERLPTLCVLRITYYLSNLEYHASLSTQHVLRNRPKLLHKRRNDPTAFASAQTLDFDMSDFETDGPAPEEG